MDNYSNEELPITQKYEIIKKLFIIPRPIFMNTKMPKQFKENDKGNREYKTKLVYNFDIYNKKCEKVATQMLYRLFEGNGKALYILGISDKGLNMGISLNELYQSIRFIIDAANIIKSNINTIRIYNGEKGYIATIRISLEINKDINVFIYS